MPNGLFTLNFNGEIQRLECLIAKVRARATRGLSLRNAQAVASGVLAPANLITFSAPAFTPRPHGSGKVLLIAGASGVMAGDVPGFASANLLRGLVTLPPLFSSGASPSAVDNFAGVMAWVDTVPAGVAVTYSVQVGSSSGSGTVGPPVGGLWLVMLELP